jgi:hypothetical protein
MEGGNRLHSKISASLLLLLLFHGGKIKVTSIKDYPIRILAQLIR